MLILLYVVSAVFHGGLFSRVFCEFRCLMISFKIYVYLYYPECKHEVSGAEIKAIISFILISLFQY